MERQSLTRAEIEQCAPSKWYQYKMACGHWVLSTVRIKVPQDYGFMENYIRCPHDQHYPTEWQPIVKMRGVPESALSSVSSMYFIVPRRIMRTLAGNPSGGLFPYTTSDRDYD